MRIIGKTRNTGKKASVKRLKKYCDELWSEIIKNKFNYKCFYCGKSNYLQSHHLISRKHLSTRYNVDNGLLLCSGCHMLSIISMHHSPWIILDKLEIERPIQYKWFLENRTKENLLKNSTIDYQLTLKYLEDIYYKFYPKNKAKFNK